MSWPTPQDYNEAVQNPNQCFCDPELRGGAPTLTPFGLPKPISGAFASVYQLNCNGRSWAVRCFLREFADLQKRYAAISAQLLAARLPFTVGFQYVTNGIRIRGTWYPILKMEWIDGEPLNTYLGQRINQSSTIQSLARQWIEVLSALHRAGIAHGDLQHGNILISHGMIKLIDYDGMYVPTLAGLPSHEEGHRNYQLPSRTGRDFGPYLDNFAGWVIFISLVAVSLEPRLWQLLGAGDEHLLFRRDDFEHPDTSQALRALDSSGVPELQLLATRFSSLLRTPLSQIPPLDGAAPRIPAPRRETSVPAWLEDISKPPTLPPLPVTGSQTAPVGADWLLDHIIPQASPSSIWKGFRFGVERTVIMASIVSVILVAIIVLGNGLPLWAGGVLSGAFVAGALSFLLVRYQSMELVSKAATAKAQAKQARCNAKQIESSIRANEAESAKLMAPLINMQAEYQGLPGKRNRDAQGIQQKLDGALAANGREMQVVNNSEAQLIRRSQETAQQKMSGFIQDRNRLDAGEQSELTSALNQMREQHIRSILRQRLIANASIRGIGSKLTFRLHARGIVTAEDVSAFGVRQVTGIGEDKARSLVTWANSIRQHATSAAPVSLPSALQDEIHRKYESQRQSLTQSIDAIQRQSQSEQRGILNQHAVRRDKVQKKAAEIQEAHRQMLTALQAKYEADKQRLISEFKALQVRTEATRKRFDTERSELNRLLFQAKVEVCKAERSVKQYSRVSLWDYIFRVVGLLRA